jgi:hypothetical protein
MNTRTTLVLKTLDAVMDQYDEAAKRANEADKAYCWCHNVWRYGAEITEDYKAIDLAMVRAIKLEEMEAKALENGRMEYAQYLSDQIDLLVYEIHAIAGNPGAQNCGVEFFIK